MLYPHQQKVIDQNPARHLLAHGTGTGKTHTSIALADGNCHTCLVICPKALVPKWQRDTEKYGDTFDSNGQKTCKYTILSKEQFKKEAKTLPPFDGVIVDEAHYFAGISSQLSKSLYWYMKKHDIKYRWLLTATPYLSTPMNIYVLARHLGHEWNYNHFRSEFFEDVRMGHRVVPKIKGHIKEKLAACVQEIGSTIDMESAVALHPELGVVPEQEFLTEYFDLTEEQKDAIIGLTDDLHITRWTHMHQIENGFLYGDGYQDTRIMNCPKNERLLQIISANNKVAVFCRYSHQIQTLAELICNRIRGVKIFGVDGSSTGEERDRIIQEAEKATNAVIIIQSQCSAGYELPSFNTIVFMSLSFSYVDYAQSCGRFLRIANLRKNRYIHLITNGIEKDIYQNVVIEKQDFNLAIYGRKSVRETDSDRS